MARKEMTMKERVAEHGGYLDCAFVAKNGRRASHCMVRAHDAREARWKLSAVLGCALTFFCVNKGGVVC